MARITRLEYMDEPKISVCVVCICKLENKYIRQFVDFYKYTVRVSHITLIDNNDKNGEDLSDPIKDYIQNGFVNVLDYRGKKAPQTKAYNEVYRKYTKEYQWFLYVDCDEYLFLNEDKDISSFLMRPEFESYQQILINWRIFDDNNQLRYSDKPLVVRFTHPMQEDKSVYYPGIPENAHCKCLVRGGANSIFFDIPHNTQWLEGLDNDIPTCDTFGNPIENSPFNMNIDYTRAELRHYRTKTIEEFCYGRFIRGRADTTQLTYDLKDFKLHNEWNEQKEAVYNECVEKLKEQKLFPKKKRQSR